MSIGPTGATGPTGPAGLTGPTGPTEQDALGMSDEWKLPLKDVPAGDVIEIGIALERLRRRTPIALVQSLSLGVAGAGFGALLAGASGVRVWAALFLGLGVWVGLLFAQHERAVSTRDLCTQFLRLVDRWPQIGAHTHAQNSDYIKAIVAEQNPSLLTRISTWREQKKAAKATQTLSGTHT